MIDKDAASALLATQLGADALLLLTDVDGVYENWRTPQQRRLRQFLPAEGRAGTYPAGSMGPKVESAALFAEQTGRIAGIGRLDDALGILAATAGTRVGADSCDKP